MLGGMLVPVAVWQVKTANCYIRIRLLQHVKGIKGKRSITVRNTPLRCGTRIAQCYLPPDRGGIPALTPAEAGTRLGNPTKPKSWIDLTHDHVCSS